MGLLGPKGVHKVGPKAAHLRGYINRGGRRLTTLAVFIVRVNSSLRYSTRRYSTACVNSAAPPVRQARGRLRGSSNPDRDASSRTCGYLGGAASAAQ